MTGPAKRRQSGGSLAESAASVSLLFPLAIVIIFVVAEASHFFIIKNGLDAGARQAARELAVVYGENQSIAYDRAIQDTEVFDNIRITNVINSSLQFDDPVFNEASDPPTVSVVVRYAGGSYGLPTFPNPDPLNLGTGFTINSTSTYRL